MSNDNRSTKGDLPPEGLKTSNDASEIQPGFPHDFYEIPMAKTVVYGDLRDRLIVK